MLLIAGFIPHGWVYVNPTDRPKFIISSQSFSHRPFPLFPFFVKPIPLLSDNGKSGVHYNYQFLFLWAKTARLSLNWWKLARFWSKQTRFSLKWHRPDLFRSMGKHVQSHFSCIPAPGGGGGTCIGRWYVDVLPSRPTFQTTFFSSRDTLFQTFFQLQRLHIHFLKNAFQDQFFADFTKFF